MAAVNGVLSGEDFGPGYQIHFESPTIRPSGAAPGHWSVAAGQRRAVMAALHGPPGSKRPAPRRTRIAQRRVTIYRLLPESDYSGVHRGHVVVRWTAQGTTFMMSVHGSRNAARLELMAAPLITTTHRMSAEDG